MFELPFFRIQTLSILLFVSKKNSYHSFEIFLNYKGKGKEIYFWKKDLHSAAYFYHVIVSTQFTPIPLPFLLQPSLPTAHSMETLLQL